MRSPPRPPSHQPSRLANRHDDLSDVLPPQHVPDGPRDALDAPEAVAVGIDQGRQLAGCVQREHPPPGPRDCHGVLRGAGAEAEACHTQYMTVMGVRGRLRACRAGSLAAAAHEHRAAGMATWRHVWGTMLAASKPALPTAQVQVAHCLMHPFLHGPAPRRCAGAVGRCNAHVDPL